MSKPLPLEGIRVVELSHMVMGPTCGLILADLGAEVIKVEPTGKGDPTRYLKSTGAGFFAAFSRNKKSVAIDLDSPRGLAQGRRLAGGARREGARLRGAFHREPAPGVLLAQGFPRRAVREAHGAR